MSAATSETLLNYCRSGNAEKVEQILVDNKLSSFSEWAEGYLLLCEALKCKKVEVAKLLLQNGAKVNTKGYGSYTLLYYAINMENAEVLKLLLNNGAIDGIDVSSLYRLLVIATGKQDHRLLDILLKTVTNGECTDIDDHKNIIDDFTTFEVEDGPECKKEFNLAQGSTKIKMRDIVEFDGNVKIGGNSLVHKAVCIAHDGNLKKVQMLLNNNFNVNARDMFGDTGLYCAYITNQFEVFKYLLTCGANIKINKYQHMLHMCVWGQKYEFTKFILEKGVDVDTRNYDGYTSLHIACRNNSVQIVKLLLKHNSNVNLSDNEGFTPLHMATKMNFEQIVNLLLGCGPFVNAATVGKMTPLHFAAKYGQKDVVQSLIESGADLKAKNNKLKTALCCAVEAGKTDIVQILLDKNPDLQDESNKLAFCLAIIGSGLKKIVELFLLRGFTIQTKDFIFISIPEPLRSEYSIKYASLKYEAIFKDLLKCKSSINGFFEYQVLLNSVKNGFVKIVQSLLKPDANVNILLENKISLLNFALLGGSLSVVDELLKRGANLDLNVIDSDGGTILHSCCNSSHANADIVAFLLKHGAKVEARIKGRGKTPLHVASREGNVKIVKLLLDSGADIRSGDDNNWTPLHFAAIRGHKDVVELLLENDAPIIIYNDTFFTPLDLSRRLIQKEVEHILLDHIAINNIYEIRLFDNYWELFSNVSESKHFIKVNSVCKFFALSEHDYGEFQSECNKEIIRMNKCHIGCNVSLYDLLKKGDSDVEMYMRNKQTVQFLESTNLQKSYPIYFSLLKARVNKAKRRNMLIRLGSNVLECIFKNILPYYVVEKICSYICNLGLQKLVFDFKENK